MAAEAVVQTQTPLSEESEPSEPAPTTNSGEQLNILDEENQFGLPLAAVDAAEAKPDQPAADKVRDGEYAVLLGDALEYNPGNEYALLNLGVVYQDTGRPELTRRTYAEIIRINRLERAALIVARKNGGLSPMALARENLADLNLSPVIVDSSAPPPSWFGNNAPIDSRNFSALYSDMSAVFDNLQALAELMRLMSDTLRTAAKEAEEQDALISAERKKAAESAAAIEASADKNPVAQE